MSIKPVRNTLKIPINSKIKLKKEEKQKKYTFEFQKKKKILSEKINYISVVFKSSIRFDIIRFELTVVAITLWFYKIYLILIDFNFVYCVILFGYRVIQEK